MKYDIKKANGFLNWWRNKIYGHFLTNKEYDKVMNKFKVNEINNLS